MRLHRPSFCDVTSRSDRVCPVEPGRHSVEDTRTHNDKDRVTLNPCVRSHAHSLTQGDAVHFGSLRVRQVLVNLLDDLLLHLRDRVTVQHLHRGDVRPLALNQHL